MKEPGWAKPAVQGAWTQAFMYYDRRWETLPKRAVAFVHLRDKLRFRPYHGPVCLHPALHFLIQERDVWRAAAGLPIPGGSEVMRI